MDTFTFRLVLADDREIAADVDGAKLQDLANQLFEAGCDDGSPGVYCGELDVTFDREAANMMDAIRSAIRQVESVGCRVVRVESPDQPFFDRINEELGNRSQSPVATDR